MCKNLEKCYRETRKVQFIKPNTFKVKIKTLYYTK